MTNAALHLPTSTQRLHRELPLSAEELEDVFDSLDAGRNGYLTLEAFSSGFSRCRSSSRPGGGASSLTACCVTGFMLVSQVCKSGYVIFGSTETVLVDEDSQC